MNKYFVLFLMFSICAGASAQESNNDVLVSVAERDLKMLQLEVETAREELDGLKEKKESLESEIGYYSQNQHVEFIDQLQSEISKHDVRIQDIGGKLKLCLSNKILFPSGMTSLTAEGIEVISKVGAVLQGSGSSIIRVEGHTDSKATRNQLREMYATNWELSAARATNVVRHLISHSGVDPKRIYAVAMSKYHPVGDNSTGSGRSLNRRIEIMIEPMVRDVVVRELQLVENVFSSEEAEEFSKFEEPGVLQLEVESKADVANSTAAVVDVEVFDVKDFKKKFQLASNGEKEAGVGYIWVRKRLSDFSVD